MGKVIRVKKHRKTKRRQIQIIKTLDLWFIRKKKQGCNGMAKHFTEIADHIAEMFSDTDKKTASNIHDKNAAMFERIVIKNRNSWHKKSWKRR